MVSRGHAGGLAAATQEVARLLDAFGLDIVLVETVAPAKNNVKVREVAHDGRRRARSHLGDEVQTLKAGLFEIADVFCVNKGDLPGAELAAKDLKEFVSMGAPANGSRPVVVTTSTRDASGIVPLWEAIEAHEGFLERSGAGPPPSNGGTRRRSRASSSSGSARASRRRSRPTPSSRRSSTASCVARIDPHSAADALERARARR